MYSICCICVFILKIKILYDWAKKSWLFISYIKFSNMSTCLCLYANNIYNNNNYYISCIFCKVFRWWRHLTFEILTFYRFSVCKQNAFNFTKAFIWHQEKLAQRGLTSFINSSFAWKIIWVFKWRLRFDFKLCFVVK